MTMPKALLLNLKHPLLLGLAAAVGVAIITLFVPNQYTSEARILAADARGGNNLGQLATAAAVVGVSIPGQDSADSAYVDILKSRWMLEQLLDSTYSFHAKAWYLGRTQEHQETLQNFLRAKNHDRGVRNLKQHIAIARDLKTKLLTLTVETKSPELSQQVCQRMVTLLDEFVVQRSSTRGGNKAAFAQKRMVEARNELAEAEDTFRTFLYTNRNYLTSADPAVRLKGLRLENELKLRTQIVTTLAISLEQALIEEKNDMPILNVLDKGNLPQEKSGPKRSTFVALAFLLGFFGLLGWENRDYLKSRLA